MTSESAETPLLATFRDPAGRLELRPDGAYRTVRPPHDEEILEFLRSPLAGSMVADGRMVGSEVLVREPELVLRHPRIAFPAYPWEWAPAMWMAAAQLTLDICSDLLKDGWILKDATPLNVLFEGTQPVFVDVLSVARAELTEPIWYAYGQFVRTFLLPMLAHTRLGWPVEAVISRRDGYEPEEMWASLPWSARLRQPALSAVTLPILFSRGNKLSGMGQTRRVDPELGQHILGKTLNGLKRSMRKTAPAAKTSVWSEYVDTATHYSGDDHAEKQSFVGRVLGALRPRRALDVGCNTGVYSRLAADAGADVVSLDTDVEALNRLYEQIKGGPYARRILPLRVNLARPTPSVGWENRESASFLERCAGQFDMVIMLAVIHHVLLGSQIPMQLIADLCARLTTKDLIIEWVPPGDPKFTELLRGRDAIYEHITETAFRAAFSERFGVIEERTLANGRILFHMRRKDASLSGSGSFPEGV